MGSPFGVPGPLPSEASSGQAPSPFWTLPGRQPWRRSSVRIQQAVSTHPVPSSRARLSGPSGVQSPGFIVREPASGPLVSTGPVSSRLVSAPVRPDAFAWSPIRRWRLGTGRCGTATRTKGTGPGPGGLPGRRAAQVDGRSRPEAGDAAEAAQGRRLSVANPGRVGCGRRPGLDAGLPVRPGRRAERPSPAAARGGHGRRPQGQVAAPAG
jgi:hypothetical protein